MSEPKPTEVVFDDYLKMLFNFSRCGDLKVIGLAILEEQEEESTNHKRINVDLVKESIEYLLKRHALLRAHIEVENNSVSRVRMRVDSDEPKWSQVEIGRDLVYGELTSRDQLSTELERLVDQRFDYAARCKLWQAGLFSFPATTDNNTKTNYALAFFLPLYMTDALNITTLTIELTNIVNSLVSGCVCDEMRVEVPMVDTERNLISKQHLVEEKQLETIDELKSNIYFTF